MHALIFYIVYICNIVRISSGNCQQFSLIIPSMGTYSCNITYTCVIGTSAFGVITLWTGSAFHCLPNNQVVLTQRASGILQPFTTVSCGSLSALTTNVTSTCYTSVLTIPAVQALNGTTVICQDGVTGAVVGNDIVRIRISELLMRLIMYVL